MVAAAEEVGSHNAKANSAVEAVHIIITLNLKSAFFEQGWYGPILSANRPGIIRPRELPTFKIAII